MSSTVETATEIRPFHVEIPEEQLEDLRRRIAANARRWVVTERDWKIICNKYRDVYNM